MTDLDLINRVIEDEGGFVNDPDDRGSSTKFGVTKATLSAWRGTACTDEDVKNLSLTEAREILVSEYIKKPGFDRIGSEVLRAHLVDYAVNSGPAQAIKSLQRCLGVKVDGVLGDVTLQAANTKTGAYLALRLNAQRLRLLGRIVTNDQTQAKFASGWCNRVADRIEEIAGSGAVA